MSKSLAAALVGATMSVSCRASGLQSNASAKTVTVPVKDGLVTINLDGQDVDLLLDSADFEMNVLDGHWYEGKYGQGACKRRGSGCYFCPEEKPCHFDGKEPVYKVSYVGNTRMESIYRNGSLSLGGHDTTDILFRVSRATHVDEDSSLYGIFGLGMPKNLQMFSVPPNVKDVLESLVDNDIIGRLSYTLRTNTTQSSDLISGELTLGDTPVVESNATNYIVTYMANKSDTDLGYVQASISPLRLFDAEGHLLREQGPALGRPESYSIHIDTGANAIFLAQAGLLDDIQSKLQLRLIREGYTYEEVIGSYWRRQNYMYVKEDVVSFLPVLGFQLTDEHESVWIKILPQHYCNEGAGVWVIKVREARFNILGTPFLRAYSIHVDFTDLKLALFQNGEPPLMMT
ncbi:hypothetical protein FOZ63_000016 [Perkinsus olseni]|uniref:Peptidase A1 domain-containing protein n=1 Tax=Perkinsus olseni TaxID=32597 RepID=A0A7J6U1Z6_PEROL|nr:hypothetical protein FOZ63_000016 [Perkinsus olseni]KAF4756736.1 hypothetical protein FOZ62_000017 [Perkinsus olseni]